MAHRGTEETVLRHRKYWNGPTIFTGPVGFTPDLPGEKVVAIGEREHHGIKSAERIIGILEYALTNHDWEFLELNEYDSFRLEDPLVPEHGMAGTFYPQNKPMEFAALFYIHYPHTYARKAVENVLRTAKILLKHRGVAKDIEYSDRFLGLAVQSSGTRFNDLKANGGAFSRNTICPVKHKEKLKLALKNGAKHFHGVKSKETLEIIETCSP